MAVGQNENTDAAFDDLIKRGKKASVRALLESALAAITIARMPPPIGSPFDTGHNRRSIGFKIKGGAEIEGRETPQGDDPPRKDADVEETINFSGDREVAVVTTSGYGGYLECGTKYVYPRPYIVPAVTGLNTQMAQIIEKAREEISGERGGAWVTFSDAVARAAGR